MTTALIEPAQLTRYEVKKYPKEVQDLLLELVNRYHVKFRIKDGSHIFLYSPDGISRPRKVSASRPGPQSVKHLVDWAAEHLNAEKVHEGDVLQLARTLNSPEHDIDLDFAKHTGRRIPVSAQPSETPSVDETNPQDPWAHLVAPGWVKHVRADGKPSSWETNGVVFRCLKCRAENTEFETDDIKKLGGHVRGNHSVGFDHLRDPDVQAKSAQKRRETLERKAREKEEAAVDDNADGKAGTTLVDNANPAEIDTTGWTPLLKDGEHTGWLESPDATEYRCLVCLAEGKDTVVGSDGRSRNGHMRFAHKDNPARNAGKARKANAARRAEPQVEKPEKADKSITSMKRQHTREMNRVKAEVETAISALGRALSAYVDPDVVKGLERQNAALQKEIDAITKERDEALTKIELMRETLGL